MKSKSIIIVAVFAALAVGTNIVKADIISNLSVNDAGVVNLAPTEQQDSTTTMKEEVKENPDKDLENLRNMARQKMEGLKTLIRSEKDLIKAKLKEERINLRQNALLNFDKVIQKISDLKDKVNLQINKLDKKGTDLSVARNSMATVEANLYDAKTKVAEVNDLLSTSVNELTLEDKTVLKNLTKDIQTIVENTRNILNITVKSLKENMMALQKPS